jgi:hypothetical protein
MGEWVFKINRNGLFLASEVACGHKEVLEINLHNSFTHVVKDSTFRVTLFAMMLWDLNAKSIDVEHAFLHRDLNEGKSMQSSKMKESRS